MQLLFQRANLTLQLTRNSAGWASERPTGACSLPRSDRRYRDLYDAVPKLERADRSNPLTVAKSSSSVWLPVQVFVRLMRD